MRLIPAVSWVRVPAPPFFIYKEVYNLLSFLFEDIFQKEKIKTLISPQDSILVALSGGPDSVFLLHFFLYIQKKIDFNIGIAHLNHLLRGKEAERDLLFCKKLSEKYSLPFFFDRINVKVYAEKEGLSIEDAARKKRYEYLINIAKKYNYNKVATAHTLDDLTETFFMRVIRGTGIFGLKGIPLVRHEKGIEIIRPLLEVSKEDILQYLNENNIPYVVDSTNRSVKYLRNYIRHNILPLFLHVNPKLKEHILNLSFQIGEIEVFLKNEIDRYLKIVMVHYAEDLVKLNLKELSKVPEFLKGFILRRGIELLYGSLSDIYSEHINIILEAIKNVKGEKDYDLPNGLKVKKSYNYLFLYKNKPFIFKKIPFYEYKLEIGEEYYLENVGVTIFVFSSSVDFDTNSFDIIYKLPYNIFKKGLALRNRQKGDRFNNKKLKEFFIDKKIPRYLRDKIPVIAIGNKILLIIGISEHKEKEELKNYVLIGVKFKRGGILWNELWKRFLSQKKRFKKELKS